MYVVITIGQDCDGVSAVNSLVPTFYTKKMAERVADKKNQHSDGAIDTVLTVGEFKNHFGIEYDNCSFYYNPLDKW